MCTYCSHKNVTMKKIEAKVLYTYVASEISSTILLVTFIICCLAMQTLRESFTLSVVVVLCQISNFFLPSCPVFSNISNLFKNAYHSVFGLFSLVFQKWSKWLKHKATTSNYRTFLCHKDIYTVKCKSLQMADFVTEKNTIF